MLTRKQLYSDEAAEILRVISSYHALKVQQVYLLYPKKEAAVKSIISSLVRQRRIYIDEETGIVASDADYLKRPNEDRIAAFWVMLDFIKQIQYHIAGEFPVCISFFTAHEAYEIISVHEGEEYLIRHVFSQNDHPETDFPKRLLMVSCPEQIYDLSIPGAVGYCTVNPDGAVSYFKQQSN